MPPPRNTGPEVALARIEGSVARILDRIEIFEKWQTTHEAWARTNDEQVRSALASNRERIDRVADAAFGDSSMDLGRVGRLEQAVELAVGQMARNQYLLITTLVAVLLDLAAKLLNVHLPLGL
jgi:capsid protein